MRASIRLIVVIVLISVVATVPGARHHTLAAPPDQAEFYAVRAGDTWGSIAAAFGVPARSIWHANGVTNPAALTEGQRLFIPLYQATPPQSVVILEAPTTVAALRAAVASGNSITSMLLVNGLSSPFQAVGQRITLPDRTGAVTTAASRGSAPPTDAPTDAVPVQPTPTSPPAPTATPYTGTTLVRSKMGIQGHFMLEDSALRERLFDMVAYEAGFGWVKQQVRWDQYEYLPDKYSDVMLATLDEVVDDAENRGMNVLLSIVKAPDWARATTEEDGPPIDYQQYHEFVKDIVQRYKGKVQAVEIWNEPNLRLEWNGAPLSGAEYVRLLAVGYDAVKSAYPEGNITVVSAGLAPTGVSDGVTAVDDRVYLRQMYEAGLANYADAVGIHPYSWANPPWARCCGDWGGSPSHTNHPSFFFLGTIEDYRSIQAEFNDLGRPLWATEFGWGTMDKLNRATPADAPFFDYLNEDLQAQYILQAYEMAQQWDFMGPMFLWNFNVAALPGLDDNQSGYSILRADNNPRRAFEVLRNTPKVEG